MAQRVDVRFGSAKDDWNYRATSGGITGTGNNTLAPALAGYSAAITTLYIKNVSAVASEFTIRDGNGGTILFLGHLPASMIYADRITFSPPLTTTPGTLLNLSVSTTATQTYVNAQGYYIQRT